MSIDASKTVVFSSVPRLEVRQVKWLLNANIDLSPFVTAVDYDNVMIWIALASTLFDLLRSTYGFKGSEVVVSLFEGVVGYSINYRTRCRIGKMDSEQYSWFVENYATITEMPDDKWELIWQGWGDGKVVIRSEAGVKFTLRESDVLAIEIRPLAPARNFLHLYIPVNVVGKPI